jgi:hypothetical protein
LCLEIVIFSGSDIFGQPFIESLYQREVILLGSQDVGFFGRLEQLDLNNLGVQGNLKDSYFCWHLRKSWGCLFFFFAVNYRLP